MFYNLKDARVKVFQTEKERWKRKHRSLTVSTYFFFSGMRGGTVFYFPISLALDIPNGPRTEDVRQVNGLA